MKKLLLISILFAGSLSKVHAQIYAPIATSGYTLDAVAENTTALSTTNGVLDGSNFVLYSAFYGTLYSIVGGLPNSGLITNAGYTYQLQPYNQNNVLFTLLGQTDSLTLNSPASYAALSLLAFATEGTGSMNIKLRFTDNSTQVFNGINLDDWFNGTTSIISGFGRASRPTGVITNPVGNPKMFNVDLILSCSNRIKLVQRIIVQNTSANARICVMAASGSSAPSYTATSTAVSCAGGTNGSASLLVTNSLPPNTYTWSSTPNQFSAVAATLTSGVYSYTVKDVAGCGYSSTVAVPVSTVPLAPLQIGSSGTLVCPGVPVTLSTSGANTYTWSNSLNSAVTTITPAITDIYSVAGTTSANCIINGSITITVHPATSVSFNSLPATMCVDAATVQLSGSPAGGVFSGLGVNQSVFYPNLAGAGVHTVSYFYSDANSCNYVVSLTTTVNALPVINFSLSPNVYCSDAANVFLTATPVGGTYTGPGISGAVFSPSLAGAGLANVTYSYTDANGCSAGQGIIITVNQAPSISFGTIPAAVCLQAGGFALTAQPSGGSFTGQGVNGGTYFSPQLAGLGAHTITYAYTNSSNSCSATKTISIFVSACTGIENNSFASQNAISIYPNPSNHEVNIKGLETTSFELFNDMGQFLGKYFLNSENQFTVQFRSLQAGLYFVSLTCNGQNSVQKLVITK